MTILFVFTCVMNVIYQTTCNRLSQALVHFVIDRASLFTLTTEYQVAHNVPSISISEKFESILVTILQQISFLLL